MFVLQPPDRPPIIINLPPPEQTSDLEGLANVLFGALGLTGVIVLGAIVFGVVVAGLIYLKHTIELNRGAEGSEGSGGGGLKLQ